MECVFFYRCTKDANVGPTEVSKKGRILLANPQCRKMCLAYAVFEGPRIWKIQSTKCGHVAWKEVDQQYRDDFCISFPSRCIRKLASSPDYLIGPEEDHRSNRQTQGLSRLQVDVQVELVRPLHGEVSRLGTL